MGTLGPGQEEAIQLSLSPRAAGAISLTARAEWDQADPESSRSLTVGAQVDPFLTFPARMNTSILPPPSESYSLPSPPKSFAALAAQPTPAVNRLFAPHFFADDQGGTTIVRLYSAEDVPLQVTGELRSDFGISLGSVELILQPGKFLVQDVGPLFGIAPQTGQVLSGYMSFELRPEGFIGFRGPFSRVLSSVEFSGGQGRFRFLAAIEGQR